MDKRKLSENIIAVTQAFRTLLERDNIPVESMIVFGSQAKGSARAGSDIDVCVVSPSFGHNDVEEMQMLFKKARRIDSRIEPYPMSSENLKATNNPIVNEIVTWGLVV